LKNSSLTLRLLAARSANPIVCCVFIRKYTYNYLYIKII